jgi:hypothetical protein
VSPIVCELQDMTHAMQHFCVSPMLCGQGRVSAQLKADPDLIIEPRKSPHRKQRLTDAELKALLKLHAHDSCRWSSLQGEGAKKFEGSVKAIWKDDPELSGVYAYTTLLKRLRRGKLGFQKGQCFSDVCPICATWDGLVSKKLAHLIGEVSRSLTDVVELFWEEFEDVTGWSAGERRYDSPEFLKAWLQYLQEKVVVLEASAILSREDLTHVMLIAHEVTRAMESPDVEHEAAWIDLVAEWNLHWTLRDLLWTRLMEWHARPKPRNGYLWIDYAKVPII